MVVYQILFYFWCHIQKSGHGKLYIISSECRWISNVYRCQFSRRYRIQQESYMGQDPGQEEVLSLTNPRSSLKTVKRWKSLTLGKCKPRGQSQLFNVDSFKTYLFRPPIKRPLKINVVSTSIQRFYIKIDVNSTWKSLTSCVTIVIVLLSAQLEATDCNKKKSIQSENHIFENKKFRINSILFFQISWDKGWSFLTNFIWCS